MTSSSRDSDLLDLERGIPTTPADVLALRRVKHSRRLSTEDYLRALARLPELLLGATGREEESAAGSPSG
jgi:hypothetical protein